MTIDQWVVDAAHRHPNKPALITKEGAIEYSRFSAMIDSAVADLMARGISHGDRVAWYGLNHAMVFTLLFACARLGAVLVPLNWRLADGEVAEIIQDCTPKLMVYDDHFKEKAMRFDDCPQFHHADLSPQENLQASKEVLPEVRTSDAILIVYTSGSTGRPKGVVLAQDALIANAEMSVDAHQMTSDDHVLNVLPLFHVGGLNILPTPAFSIGATVVLHEGFDPDAVIKTLPAIDLMIVVPTILQIIMAHPDWANLDLTQLRALSIGSTDVPVHLIEAVHERGVPVVQIYGATETAPFAIYQNIQEAFDTAGSIGRAGKACEIALKNPDGNDVALGEDGEICVKGKNILSAYWQNPELTDEMIIDGWFHTGDIARCDEDGLYWFTDRIKHVIISGGENIYPAEVERVLRSCQGIIEVAVVGQSDERWGEVPVAVIAANGEVDGQTILDFMDGKLARYKQPRRIVFVDALPRNAMNKVVVDEVKQLLT